MVKKNRELTNKDFESIKKKRFNIKINIKIKDIVFVKTYYVFKIILAAVIIYILNIMHYTDYIILDLKSNMLTYSGVFVGLLIQLIIYLYFSKYYKIQENLSKTGLFLETFTNIYIISMFVLIPELIASFIKFFSVNMVFSSVYIYYYTIIFVYLILVYTFKILNKTYTAIDVNVPYMNILVNGGNPVANTLNYLEENTGITMRSLWSVKLIKEKVPLYITVLLGTIWMMTCFVQIKTFEEGAVYRYGRLSENKILQPGLHLKLPWPVEKVKIIPVDRIKFLSIGFQKGEIENYLWTQGHTIGTVQYDENSGVTWDAEAGSSVIPYGEYTLLMGDGREAVSINMKISYRIDNIIEYLTTFKEPEKKLEADAYELVMLETVKTNLSDLLTRDRYEFAEKIHKELDRLEEERPTGLDVTQVMIMSIHPPLDVADIYQEVNNARTQKETMTNKAKGTARAAILQAELKRARDIASAEIKDIERKANAYSETYKYSFQREAYNIDKNFFAWRKWIETFEKTMKGKNIYIIEENSNTDDDSIWFGYKNVISGGKN